MSSAHHVVMGQLRTKSLFRTIDQTSNLIQDLSVAYCRFSMSLQKNKKTDQLQYKHITRLVPQIFYIFLTSKVSYHVVKTDDLFHFRVLKISVSKSPL